MRYIRSLLVSLYATLQASRVVSSASCDLASLIGLLDPGTNATIQSATYVPAGGEYGPGGYAQDPDFPNNATGLPALCAIMYSVTGPDGWVLFSFGMFLPDDWNERLMGAGNTGFGGGIDWQEMGPLSLYGFAMISTDTGHLSNPGHASWANNAPIHQALWGGVALHQSVVLAKQIVKSYYGRNATYSYYSACSGGGRQGLKEVQAYPEDFDGVIAGAAPWLLTHLHPWAVHVALPNVLADRSDIVTDAHFDVFAAEVVRQCDAQDGLTDQVVADPYGCQFDYASLLCNSTTYNNTSSVCFSTGQLDVLKATYTDWRNSTDDSKLIWPSFSLTGKPEGLVGSQNDGAPSGFGTEYIENFVMNNTSWDWHTINDSVVTLADILNPGSANADDFDLSNFKTRGGKLITYHGLSDPLIPTGSSIYYYEQVLSTMSNGSSIPSQDRSTSTAALDDFYRMFLVPGMAHCSWDTGSHPRYFAGAGQPLPTGSSGHSVPGFEDPQHDIVLALMAWVENGTAPASLTATEWQNRNVAEGVTIQRPICPYPQQAKFQGGAAEDASSWVCASGSGSMVGYDNILIASKATTSSPVATKSAVSVSLVATNAAAPTSTSTVVAAAHSARPPQWDVLVAISSVMAFVTLQK